MKTTYLDKAQLFHWVSGDSTVCKEWHDALPDVAELGHAVVRRKP